MTVIQTATVLIVEDTPSERELISHYLQEEGYSVIHAVTAQEGMDKARSSQPDVIVTDVVMPGMSGFELCRSLKRAPETSTVPVVICSSKDQAIDRLWGMRQGADAYITKPFNREELLKVVKSVL
ncbi:response regulator transcription factor [Leptothoe kymatousa]|uniref:Response regulator n=1 Tax=Leptothoe kymatousa TAU-MAC 1615 TaxID=2364775 RepID=A0ABS5Y237_9CYAN|nr:response regulator [Leptothoe kymatousa]MBT9311898.1 response regulator [Leptothoe kymatousa TAU-MAC 1615]